MLERERTPFEVMYYAVYLVFEGLSFRASARPIKPFIQRSHKSVWQWCQEIGQEKSIQRLFRLARERVRIFAIDETGVNVAGQDAYLFVAYGPFAKRTLGLYFAWNPNSISVGLFLRNLMRKYGRHQVLTDAGDWYHPACESIGLKHHVYLKGSWLWEVMERCGSETEGQDESFDDLFPSGSHGLKCRLKHVWNWINLFSLHNQPTYQMYIEVIMEDMKRPK